MSRLFLTVSAAVLVTAISLAASAQTPPATTPPAETPPAAAAPAAPNSVQPAPVTPADPFGVEVTLEPKTFVYMKGTATWETAFETLVDSFKSITDYLEKQKITPSGRPLA